ncbi:hypothetical protein GGI43DRAFT_294626 [Trichoderma evansii]
MVLLEHLPLLGLALGLAHYHHHHGRAHSHPPHLSHATVPQISDGTSQLHQAPPKLIAARASDESHETTIQVTQTHLQGILDRIKSLEEEISRMMASRANSFLDFSSIPVQQVAQDPDDIEFSKATMAAMKPARLVATTKQETKTTPGAVVGGLFKEASVNLSDSDILDQHSTIIVTSTTRITRLVTIVPTMIVTFTTISTNPAKESKSKALIPFSSETAAVIPPKATLADGPTVRPFSSSSSSSSASAETGLRQPTTTSLHSNASMTFHRASLPKMSSGFLTVRRAARSM